MGERRSSIDEENSLFVKTQSLRVASHRGSRLKKLLEPSDCVTKRNLILLACINANEAFAINVLWSFVAFMVEDFGVPSEELGSYVGPLASSFFVAQLIGSFFWAAISDRFGRRPSLLLGLLGSSTAMFIFGFSKNYAHAVIARSLCGLLNGNIAVTKTYLGEVSNAKTQARGFSALALSWALGSITAPVVGGLLSAPVKKYPTIFGGSAVFVEFPYLLPCIASSLVGFTGVVCSFFLLPETKAFHERKQERERERREQIEETANVEGVEMQGPGRLSTDGYVSKRTLRNRSSLGSRVLSRVRVALRLLKHRDVISCCLAYCTLALTAILVDEMVPLYLKASINYEVPLNDSNGQEIRREGGLGAGTQQIGALLSVAGVSLIIFQLVFYPSVIKRLKARKSFLVGVVGSAIYVALFPLSSPLLENAANLTQLREFELSKISAAAAEAEVIAESGLESAGATQNESAAFTPWPFAVWCLLCCIMVYRAVVLSLAFSSSIILVNNSAPVGALATVNAIAQCFASSVRAIGPLIGGALWTLAVSLSESLRGFNVFVPFIVISLLMLAVTLIGLTLRKYLDIPAKERTAEDEVDTAKLLSGGSAAPGRSRSESSDELLHDLDAACEDEFRNSEDITDHSYVNGGNSRGSP